MTGSIPGIAASTSETWLFGSPPNSVDAPEKSFAFDVTWAWTSMPITTSQSPVSPLRSFDFFACAMRLSYHFSSKGNNSGTRMAVNNPFKPSAMPANVPASEFT